LSKGGTPPYGPVQGARRGLAGGVSGAAAIVVWSVADIENIAARTIRAAVQDVQLKVIFIGRETPIC